jgi:hypothetical protein
MKAWMIEREYESVAQLKGSMCQTNLRDASALARQSYIRVLDSFTPRPGCGADRAGTLTIPTAAASMGGRRSFSLPMPIFPDAPPALRARLAAGLAALLLAGCGDEGRTPADWTPSTSPGRAPAACRAISQRRPAGLSGAGHPASPREDRGAAGST